jgi:hypothetical protein
MAQKKQWRDMTRSEKIIGSVVFAVVVVVVLLIIGALVNGQKNSKEGAQSLADKVTVEVSKLDDDTKSTLAATSVGGYQGDIIAVEPHSDDTVKVRVSTYFNESGDEKEGGKNIARNIFNTICADLPELESLYVVSDSSGLESRSVYRSESACR